MDTHIFEGSRAPGGLLGFFPAAMRKSGRPERAIAAGALEGFAAGGGRAGFWRAPFLAKQGNLWVSAAQYFCLISFEENFVSLLDIRRKKW